MATEILATASTAANSADVAVATGNSITVCLKGVVDPTATPGPLVTILLKDDAAAYNAIDTLTGQRTALVLVGPGTYRFTRRAGVTCGVFSG
jgi:hypothetical protein